MRSPATTTARRSSQAREDPSPEETRPNARRLVIEGNRAWLAAATVRHRWLAGLFGRRTAPPEIARFVAGQLLQMGDPLRSGLSQDRYRPLLAELTSHDYDQLTQACSTAAGRLPLLMLAPVVVAYEHAMTDGETAKSTWRHNRYSPCPRAQAGTYLRFLASLGYQLSGIEQAVADDRPYTGAVPDGAASGQLGPAAGSGSDVDNDGADATVGENRESTAGPGREAA